MSVLNLSAQTLTHQFVDPCTGQITYFSVPAQGTIVFFLGQSRSFTSADVQSGVFQSWVNQVYADYRKVSPCGQQQGQVTQNQITSQIVSSTVQSVVGSIMSSAQSAAMGGSVQTTSAVSSSGGGNDGASKNNNSNGGGRRNNSQNNGNSNNNNTNTSSSNANQNGGQSNGSGSTASGNGGSNSTQGGTTSSQGGNNTGGNNSTQGGGSSSQQPVTSGGSSTQPTSSGGGSSTGEQSNTNNQTRTEQKGEEVGATTTMNVDVRNDRGGSDNSSSESSGGGGGGSKGSSKSGGKGGARSNPLIVSSDLTTAQNLNKSFTPIINISMGASSMTGMSSYGVTSMVWLNFKQFALSGRYTKTHFNKKGSLKFIHNFNLTSVYSYGNILGFVGYSGILNAGKWGVTGFNISAAASIIAEDKSGYYSPSITAFYTRPFKTGKRLIISPEIYIISTPLVYSSKEKVTVTDKYFSGFLGSGFDYTLTKRFKFNFNYKMNLSTNPEFPILSFFLVGSKINL